MRTWIRAGLVAIALLSLGAPVTAAAGPQLMPDAACNAERVGYAAQGYYNTVPHWKDWDGDGEFACYHLNLGPFTSPGDDTLE